MRKIASDKRQRGRDSHVFSMLVRVASQSQSLAETVRLGTLVLVGTGSTPKRLQFLCPCGCGEVVSLNLLRDAGPAWRLEIDEESRVSVWPSVRRQSGCKSHFVLAHNVAHIISSEKSSKLAPKGRVKTISAGKPRLNG